MKHLAAIALVIAFTPLLCLAQGKKKHTDLPALFESAHYLYVESIDGDVLRPGLYPPDRQAIYDVQDAVREWNRYAVAVHRTQADLVLVVRRGRLAEAQGHAGVSLGTPNPPNRPATNHDPGQQDQDTEIGAKSEVGPEDDMLRVYTLSGDGKLNGPIWSREMKDGLDGPALPLFRQLKTAVEHAYPSASANKQPTP